MDKTYTIKESLLNSDNERKRQTTQIKKWKVLDKGKRERNRENKMRRIKSFLKLGRKKSQIKRE